MGATRLWCTVRKMEGKFHQHQKNIHGPIQHDLNKEPSVRKGRKIRQWPFLNVELQKNKTITNVPGALSDRGDPHKSWVFAQRDAESVSEEFGTTEGL
jgi:hypothetical protein